MGIISSSYLYRVRYTLHVGTLICYRRVTRLTEPLSLSVLNANQGDKEKNLLATLDKIILSSLLEIKI